MAPPRTLLALGLAAVLLAAAPLALAATSTSSSSTTSSSSNQNVNIPFDNVLAALALGLRGPGALSAISSGSSTSTTTSSASQNVALGTNDVLAALALGRSGGSLGGFFGSTWSPVGFSSSGWDMGTSSWPLMGSSLGSRGLTTTSLQGHVVYVLDPSLAATLLRSENITAGGRAVLLANNTTLASLLADPAAVTSSTTMASGAVDAQLADGTRVLIVPASDESIARLM
ncbi:MAG: hypothetical protein QOE90_2900 [Thermoplasmata archaeon]|jgi:hypothetical protein|nr:hypothetical protein [Thermoplasmata archaeon]